MKETTLQAVNFVIRRAQGPQGDVMLLRNFNKQLDAAPPEILPWMQSLGEIVASYPAKERP